MKKIFYLLSPCLLVLILNTHAQIYGVKKPDIKSIPDIDIYDLSGNHTTLKKLAKNKVLFIDNWFIPCPPCFMEMKMLHRLYAKYGNEKEFCFITISRTDSSIVRKFIAKDSSLAKYVNTYQYFSQLNYFKLPVYFLPGCNAKVIVDGKTLHQIDPDHPAICPDDALHFSGYPTVIIFDKKGNTIFNKTGYDGNEAAAMAEIEKVINTALASN